MAEDGIAPIWARLTEGKPASEDVIRLLMCGGIPGVCGPGRTADEREMIMAHNSSRAGIVNRVLAAPAISHGKRRSGQRLVATVDSSEEDLLLLVDGVFAPSTTGSNRTREAKVFLLYAFMYAALASWMYFAIPLTVALPEMLASARDWVDAPHWAWWMSFSGCGVTTLCLTHLMSEYTQVMCYLSVVWHALRVVLSGIAVNIVIVFYFKWTVKGVSDWGSNGVGYRVGTFFLVVWGVVAVGGWAATSFSLLWEMYEYYSDDSGFAEDHQPLEVPKEDWQSIRACAASILRVEDAVRQLEERGDLVRMIECMFAVVDTPTVKTALERGTYVQDQYSAMVWLCIDALANLRQDRRGPEFALSIVCSFCVTIYDVFSSTHGWCVEEPARAPIVASTTGRGASTFDVVDGWRKTSKDRAYVEKSSGAEGTEYSFDPQAERSAGRPYPSSCGVVRVTIPPSPKPFVSTPEHTGLLGLVNTAAAIWFLVNWESDVYHVFLAAAVCGELWAHLWVGIWWCAGEAPLVAFVDPVHWLLSQREHVPDGAIRLLSGEASAAVLGVVAALTVIENYVAGGVVGAVALVIAGVLQRFVERAEDIAIVCFLAYLSELIIEVVIVVTNGNFTLVNVVLGVTAALESMVLTIRLLQVLVGRSLIGRELPVGARLDGMRENWFARSVACGYWGAVFTGHRPTLIMESLCSGSKTLSPSVLALATRVGYEEAFHAGAHRTPEEPGWGYIVSATGSETSTAWGPPASQGFTVFEVGSWYGKRYPCL